MSEVEITERIFRFVCGWFSVTKRELLSRSRRRVLVDARTVLCYAMRHSTDITLIDLGKKIRRTHVTVMYHAAKGAECVKDRKLNPSCHDAIRALSL